jgi:hypothetical protein
METLYQLATINFTGLLLAVKIFFLLISVFFLLAIIFFLSQSSFLKFSYLLDFTEFFTFKPYGLKKIVKEWTAITRRLDTGLESEYKLAIIEADSLLDDILKKMGFGGETLGEKLEKLTYVSLSSVDDAREAHKTRNNIVHDPDYRLSLDDAKKTISIYEKSLIDLQAL